MTPEARQAKSVEQDNKFWDSVDRLTEHLILEYGVQKRRVYSLNTDGSSRVISIVTNTVQTYTSDVYKFFSGSPLFCTPYQSTLIDRSGITPYALGSRELLMKLRNICANDLYVTAVCRQVDPYFRQGDNQFWDKDQVRDILVKEDTVTQVRQCLSTVYPQWLRYVKRHSRFQPAAMSLLRKLDLAIQCIDGLRNYDFKHMTSPTYLFLNRLSLIDKTLCFCGPVDKEKYPDFPGPVLTQEFWTWSAKNFGLKASRQALFSDTLRLYQRYLIQTQSPQTVPTFSFLWDDKQLDVFYDKKSGTFSCHDPFALNEPPGVIRINIQPASTSDPPKEFLYYLTEGNWETLIHLAKIAAYCLGAEKLFPGVIGITDRVSPEFCVMLDWITGENTFEEGCTVTLKEAVQQRARDWLILKKIRGGKLILCDGTGVTLSQEQWKRLKKLLSGASVTYKDRMLGRMLHKNVAQWIISGDDNTWQAFSKQEIPVLMAPQTRQETAPDGGCSIWLQTIFPLWGLLVSNQKKLAAVSVIPHTVDQFVKCRCTLLDHQEDFLPARTLYEAYLAFCSEQDYPDHLKFKDFNAVLEHEYGLLRTRRHISKADNKTGFYKIRLNSPEDYLDAPTDAPKGSKEVFFYQLDQIQDEVIEHFPDFPFQALFHKNQ